MSKTINVPCTLYPPQVSVNTRQELQQRWSACKDDQELSKLLENDFFGAAFQDDSWKWVYDHALLDWLLAGLPRVYPESFQVAGQFLKWCIRMDKGEEPLGTYLDGYQRYCCWSLMSSQPSILARRCPQLAGWMELYLRQEPEAASHSYLLLHQDALRRELDYFMEHVKPPGIILEGARPARDSTSLCIVSLRKELDMIRQANRDGQP